MKRLDWKMWLYGVIAAAIGGGAAALTTIPAGQIFGAADFTPRQLASVFLGSAIASAALYLKQSPLPKIEE
jgi:hypothetical protein